MLRIAFSQDEAAGTRLSLPPSSTKTASEVYGPARGEGRWSLSVGSKCREPGTALTETGTRLPGRGATGGRAELAASLS